MSVKTDSGTPACTIFYSGPAEVFNRAKPVLMVFRDRTLFVGHEIGHASAFGENGRRRLFTLLMVLMPATMAPPRTERS